MVKLTSEAEVTEPEQSAVGSSAFPIPVSSLDFTFSLDTELRLVWDAEILTNPFAYPPTRTLTHGHAPTLAQDIPEVEVEPSSFLNPLAHLALDETPGLNQEIQSLILENKMKQQRPTFSRPSTCSRATISRLNSRKRFLHTIPNKYLPIPPLTRSAYFYTYGRCPMCAGQYQDLKKIPGREKAAKKYHDWRTLQTVQNYTKDGPLDHLPGKVHRQLSDGRAQMCLKKIHEHIKYINELREFWSSDPTLQMNASCTRGGAEKEEEEEEEETQPPNKPKRCQDFYTEDAESIATFASAKEEAQDLTGRTVSKSTGSNQYLKLNSNKFTPRCMLKPEVEDVRHMYSGMVILSAKIKDFDLHVPLISLDTEEMRELYTVTILRDNSLKRIFNFKNIARLPEELQYLRVLKRSNEPDLSQVKMKDADADNDAQFRVAMADTSTCILSSIASHFYEADFLVLGLFTSWFSRARYDPRLMKLQATEEFTKLFQLLGEELFYRGSDPSACTRLELLYVLATASTETKLRHQMWTNVRFWLEPLLSNLIAERSSSRQECCYTLAYLFSSNKLVEDMRHNLTLDIPFDVTAAVVRAIETCPSSFMHYFCLLGYMIEGCPNISILRCITEKGPTSKNLIFRQRWPLLIYYAFRFWKMDYLQVDPLYPKHTAMELEAARKDPISRRAAKMALCAISIRTRSPVPSVTCWFSAPSVVAEQDLT
ncbi:unnamed protein product [Schistocephalus solidus]|uniref:SET domain-containing protein n=1 Tax=Schistocephalus solidus TaxID=70667 RepID=A0A183SVI9_SCHSO|nr:unnamed protein product [Schistocephalus solidus]